MEVEGHPESALAEVENLEAEGVAKVAVAGPGSRQGCRRGDLDPGGEPGEARRHGREQVQRDVLHAPVAHARRTVAQGLEGLLPEPGANRPEGVSLVDLEAQEELLHEEAAGPREAGRAVPRWHSEENLPVPGDPVQGRAQRRSQHEEPGQRVAHRPERLLGGQGGERGGSCRAALAQVPHERRGRARSRDAVGANRGGPRRELPLPVVEVGCRAGGGAVGRLVLDPTPRRTRPPGAPGPGSAPGGARAAPRAIGRRTRCGRSTGRGRADRERSAPEPRPTVPTAPAGARRSGRRARPETPRQASGASPEPGPDPGRGSAVRRWS